MAILTKIRLNSTHAKLDRLLSRNKNTMLLAVRKWFDFMHKQIVSDLTSKFVKDITSELTDWEFIEEQGEKILKPIALTIMQTGGQEAYKLFRVSGSFDVLNVEAVKAAEKFCATLVREVSQKTKEGIRTFISMGIKEGKSMTKIARELRPLVGLTEGQTESIMNYRILLEDKEKFPDLFDESIDGKVQRYSDQTHRLRTETIARTETARAQNIGYVEGLKEAGVEKTEFSAYTGCCEECDGMDGKEYDVDGAEDLIPVHPNCRCALLPVME